MIVKTKILARFLINLANLPPCLTRNSSRVKKVTMSEKSVDKIDLEETSLLISYVLSFIFQGKGDVGSS